MTPGHHDLNLYRGDSYKWQVRLWSDEAQTDPVVLDGATVKSEIRDRSGGTVILELGCTITPPNTIDLVLDPADWALAPTTGVWDLQVTMSDGTINTVVAGKVTVTGDVTDSIAVPARR
jgi:hypothetical protein